jgi:translation initiation factor IF-2
VAKVRIYEIARDLDLESKDVLERALELGYELKTASSSVEEGEAELIKQALTGAPVEAELLSRPPNPSRLPNLSQHLNPSRPSKLSRPVRLSRRPISSPSLSSSPSPNRLRSD